METIIIELKNLIKIIEELSEYNSNTSAQHPTYNDEDDDIV